jgi:hypothetical protein
MLESGYFIFILVKNHGIPLIYVRYYSMEELHMREMLTIFLDIGVMPDEHVSMILPNASFIAHIIKPHLEHHLAIRFMTHNSHNGRKNNPLPHRGNEYKKHA